MDLLSRLLPIVVWIPLACACDLLPEPFRPPQVSASATGDPGASGSAGPVTGETTDAPITVGTTGATNAPTTAGTEAETGATVTSGVTTGGTETGGVMTGGTETGGTETGGTGTGGDLCEWEDCDDGNDDNCDEVPVCTGAVQGAAPMIKTVPLNLFVAPSSPMSVDEFLVFGTYTAKLTAPPALVNAPLLSDSAVFAARYDAVKGTLTWLASRQNAEIITIRRDAGRLLFAIREPYDVDLPTDDKLAVIELKGETFVDVVPSTTGMQDIWALAANASKLVVVGKCVELCVYVYTPNGVKQGTQMPVLEPLNLDLVHDVLIDETNDRHILVGLRGDHAALATFPAQVVTPLPAESLYLAGAPMTSSSSLTRLAWNPSRTEFFAAGTFKGSVNESGPTVKPVGDGTCSPDSEDLVVLRLAPDLAIKGGVRSSCANGGRKVQIRDLAVDPTGDVFVAGRFTRALEFTAMITKLELSTGWDAMFVARLAPELAGAPLRWLRASTQAPNMANRAFATSVALDEKHVVLAGMFDGPSLEFKGDGMNAQDVVLDGGAFYAGAVVSLFP